MQVKYCSSHIACLPLQFGKEEVMGMKWTCSHTKLCTQTIQGENNLQLTLDILQLSEQSSADQLNH